MGPTKTHLRRQILTARSAAPPAVRADETRALRGHLSDLIGAGHTVCGYVPVGTEPGSLELADDLVRRGVRVLLPIARQGSDGTALPLRWGVYHPDKLIPAPFGLREPTEPWLPADAVSSAAAVLVPALAVDRDGVRLGRGGGFYDRSLTLVDAKTRLVAIVRDVEFVDRLPHEPHDVRMTHVLTPHRGLITLARRVS